MLYIPFRKFRYLGGPSSFMSNLKNYLDKTGYPYTESFFKADGIFFPMGYRAYKLWAAKRMGMKIIQRLDGVYYPSKHGERYYKFNSLQLKTYRYFSDFVIFQSEYSKKQVFEIFGEIDESKYAIIYNGANSDIFYPTEKKELSGKIKFITTGNFRNVDMLEPIILALDEFVGERDFELNIVGPINNDLLRKYLNRDYIVKRETKDLKGVADILRSSDIFIYSHLNPPCPNSVVEAVSCGLPIVGFDSGAMSELCYFSKDLLAYVSDEVFQRYEDFDYKKLAEKIELLIRNYDYYKKIAMDYSGLYNFDETGAKYAEAFDSVLKRKES